MANEKAREIAGGIVHEWVDAYLMDDQDMTRKEHVQCLIEWERRGGLTTESIDMATDYVYGVEMVACIREELFNLLTVWAVKS